MRINIDPDGLQPPGMINVCLKATFHAAAILGWRIERFTSLLVFDQDNRTVVDQQRLADLDRAPDDEERFDQSECHGEGACLQSHSPETFEPMIGQPLRTESEAGALHEPLSFQPRMSAGKCWGK